MWNPEHGTIRVQASIQDRRLTHHPRSWGHLSLVLLMVLPAAPMVRAQSEAVQPASGEWCPAGTPCRAVWTTESTFAKRMGDDGAGPEVLFGTTLGVVKQVTPRVGVGAVVWAALGDLDAFVAVGPRVRLRTSPRSAVDLMPLIVVTGDRPEAGPLWLDVSWMYRDRVGVAVQVSSAEHVTRSTSYPYTATVERRPVILGGLRLGSKPGRAGILVQVAAVAAAMVVFASS